MVRNGIVLGHRISKDGIEVDQEKIEIMTRLEPPTLFKGIRSFLGHAWFYRRFINDFSKVVIPLTRLLCKDVTLVIDKECHEAFLKLKKNIG